MIQGHADPAPTPGCHEAGGSCHSKDLGSPRASKTQATTALLRCDGRPLTTS